MKQPIRQGIPFTQVANSVLNDKELSWEAKGLFTYLYSKPETWDFSATRIATDAPGGRKVVERILHELEEFGYLQRKKQPSGRVNYFFTADHEKPTVPNGTKVKTQCAVSLSAVWLRDETLPISNKDKTSNKEVNSNKESVKASNEASPMGLQEFISWCKKSTQRHVHIIADYADERQLQYTTKGQWNAFLSRNLRPAKSLSPYTDDQVGAAMKKLYQAEYLTDWTLETVVKFLDK